MRVCDIRKIRDQPKLGTFDFLESDHEGPRKHAELSTYNDEYIKSYKLYGVIRNPYARMVSWWRWQMRNRKLNEELFPFSKFLSQGDGWWGWRSMIDNYFHTTHACKYQFKFIRNEVLDDDFLNFCNDVGLGEIILPRKNKTTHKHYTEYYDSDTRQVVAGRHAKDLEYFGYKFGE